MTTDTQLTIDGAELDEQLRVETTGRVIRPFQRMIDIVVDEYKIAVTDDGLHVRAVDAPNVMYVDAVIPVSELETLSIEGDETAIAVSSSHFADVLSDARYGKSTDDPVTLSTDGATLESVIDREYGGVPATVTNRAELIDPAAVRAEPDVLDMDRVSFAFPPDAFIDVVGSFDSFGGRSVKLSVADELAKFDVEGDTRSRQIDLAVDADGEVPATHYSLSYLKSIAKGLKTGYAESMTVHISHDYPLSVRAVTEQNLMVEYTVAPRVGSD